MMLISILLYDKVAEDNKNTGVANNSGRSLFSSYKYIYICRAKVTLIVDVVISAKYLLKVMTSTIYVDW